MWWTQSASSSWDIIHVSKDWRMEGLCGHRLQSGEGRPGLEAVFRGETCSWESPPVPAVQEVAVEMCIPIERVVGVRCHPSFLLRFSSVCRTGDEERPTLVLLKDRWDSPFHPAAHYLNTFKNTIWLSPLELSPARCSHTASHSLSGTEASGKRGCWTSPSRGQLRFHCSRSR